MMCSNYLFVLCNEVKGERSERQSRVRVRFTQFAHTSAIQLSIIKLFLCSIDSLFA
jgi:hypothetical protein